MLHNLITNACLKIISTKSHLSLSPLFSPQNPNQLYKNKAKDFDFFEEVKKKRRNKMGLATMIWDLVPFAAMILVECTQVGVSTISKAAMRKGMSNFVFLVYYNALGTLILFPYFILRR